ncbi:MAG TPA: urate hydroxylase PuuD, partial [Nitrospiria bacterium]|nr:urate hydroxylase PuuD [Nitrospiria bacterium]
MPGVDPFELLFRWIHFLAGITWIGLLYFFNLVNVNFMKSLDAGTKGKVVPLLMPPALWWFRWSAAVTVLAGLLIMMMKWPGSGSWRVSISIGGALGIIMLFNVWVIIWPNQKRIIQMTAEAAAKQQSPPAEMAAMARKAYLASRANFYLSIPLLFFMALSHYL